MKIFNSFHFAELLLAGAVLLGTLTAQAETSPQDKGATESKAQVKAALDARLKAEADAKIERDAEVARQEKLLKDADALIKAGKPDQAYELLLPMEFERSGEVRFDYLLGVAALDSGKADKATLAFERVLTVEPNYAGARLDMARAYYQLGDLPRAKTEFETVLKANPPEAARATIQKYLAAIDTRMHVGGTRISGYLEGTGGRDTNINTATSQPQIAVPALGNLVFDLNQTSLRNAAYYLGWGGGLNVLRPLNETVALYAGADMQQRDNRVMNQFDMLNMNGTAGGIIKLGKQDSLKLGVSDGLYTLGNVRYFHNGGWNGEWRHEFSPSDQISVFGQKSFYRFVNSVQYEGMDAQNFNQGVAGTSWTHVMADGKSTVFGSVFLGQESDVTGMRPDGGKHFDGLRVGGQTSLNAVTELFGNVGMNSGRYGTTNALFLVNRHDIMSDATLGLNWHLDKQWTVRPQVVRTHNLSNIPLYDYDRADMSVSIRRNFN